MKAHYNPISKKLQKHINANADARFVKQRDDYVRRVLKLVCLSLNRRAGWGCVRGSRIIEDVVNLSRERAEDQDGVFWYRADRDLKSLGYKFPDEDYERMDG